MNLLRGRFSIEWSQMQAIYLQDNHLRDRTRSGFIWVTTMIDLLWEQWFDLWKQRNDDRHGRDEATKTQAQHDQVLREITLLYSKRATVLAIDRDLFATPLAEKLQGKTNTLRQWVHTYGPLIKLSVRDAQLVVTTGVRRITDYFRPEVPP